ncbi:MAG: glycosyltransferase [Candidatus Altiarchaeales archaeon]|nr:glycosyltransferase [Candidatus Altiarchaeales archaeon]MBD3415632.1 glycosyltransferase [Candidatus Altiarchaeales archaeon]
MRVCMFAMMMPAHVAGGMEIHTLELCRGLASAGHHVSVITGRHPNGIEYENVEGVGIHYVDVKATSKKPMGGKALEKLGEMNSEREFDVIHSQSFAAYHYISSGLKDKLGIPIVTTLHGTSRGEIRSNLNQGLSLTLLPKMLFHIYNQKRYSERFVRGCDAVISISKELTENIPREFKITEKKVKTIYNGIDTEKFKPADSEVKSKYPGKRILLAVSVLHRQKGVQYLIKAFRKVHERHGDTHLMIVGEGPYRERLEQMAREFGLSDLVSFAGKVPNNDLWKYYNAAYAFIIPTVRVEGLPLIELESMSCGKPVVASDIGGIPTVIEDGVNGLLVEPGNVDMLVDRISRVLEDRGLASRLGENARETIVDGFSREKMVEDTVRAYEEAISG